MLKQISLGHSLSLALFWKGHLYSRSANPIHCLLFVPLVSKCDVGFHYTDTSHPIKVEQPTQNIQSPFLSPHFTKSLSYEGLLWTLPSQNSLLDFCDSSLSWCSSSLSLCSQSHSVFRFHLLLLLTKGSFSQDSILKYGFDSRPPLSIILLSFLPQKTHDN